MDIQCEQCAVDFGPAVGTVSIITVGRSLLALEGVIAVECEMCHHLTGQRPAITSGAVTAIVCPGCKHKRGEVFPLDGFCIFASGGRTVYALRAIRIQCGRCDADFEPASNQVLPPALKPTPRRPKGVIPRGITRQEAG